MGFFNSGENGWIWIAVIIAIVLIWCCCCDRGPQC